MNQPNFETNICRASGLHIVLGEVKSDLKL